MLWYMKVNPLFKTEVTTTATQNVAANHNTDILSTKNIDNLVLQMFLACFEPPVQCLTC